MRKPKNLNWPATLIPDYAAFIQRREFSEFLARDNVAISAPNDCEGYNPGEEYKYWLAGFSDYLNIRQKRAGFLKHDLSILDVGGSTGRVARHISYRTSQLTRTIADANIN
jgi:hypothetical protein